MARGSDEGRLYSQATNPLHPFKLVPEGIGEVLFKKLSIQCPFCVIIEEKKNAFLGIICASLK